MESHIISELLVVHSTTHVKSNARDKVVVCGSHGGRNAVAYAIAHEPLGIIANDAGIGKDQAGIGGLALGDEYWTPVAVVDCRTARIGNGQDTLEHGIVSRSNSAAEEIGVVPNMSARDAAAIMLTTDGKRRLTVPGHVKAADAPLIVSNTYKRVIITDSASGVRAQHADCLLITGSHGGIVGEMPLRFPVLCAVFNDAGIGKEQAGTSRLAALEQIGVMAFTVDYQSARIGDALDTLANGKVSFCNNLASARGVAVDQTTREAIWLVLGSLSDEMEADL